MSKYHNIRTEVDGIKFSSKKEAARYQELKLLEKAGEIKNLELQPRFDFPINDDFLKYPTGRKVTYTADFGYAERIASIGGVYHKYVIEDSKGYMTRDTKIRLALMKAVHGITVRIT